MRFNLQKAPAEIVVALVFFSVGVFFLVYFETGTGVPRYEALQRAEGQLSWVRQHKYGVRFGFLGERREFDYPSKAKAVGLVFDTLSPARAQNVVIMYDSTPRRPAFSEPYFNVWEISVGGKRVRTFEQVVSSWESDNQIFPWVGGFMLLVGAGIGVAAWRKTRSA